MPAAPRCHDPVALRCLIVDDNAPVRAAARALLEQQGITVVGLAATSTEALRLAQDLQPDVALVDIELAEESGFDLAPRLTTEAGLAARQVILISTYAERDLADLIAASPAAGFLSKADLARSTIESVLASAQGNSGYRPEDDSSPRV